METAVEQTTGRLTRDQWLAAAMEVLAERGPTQLNIQTLCDALNVSRGSFYWHFKGRADFVDAILQKWHHDFTEIVRERISTVEGDGRQKFTELVRMVLEEGLTRLDPAIRAWALLEPAVAQQVSRTDKFRLTYIRSLFADMGFRGNQLDMRSENALGAITMQDHLRVRHKPRKAADTAFLMTQIYFDVANQREHKQGRRLK